MVGELGHEREAETAGLQAAEPVRSLKLPRSLNLGLEPVGPKDGPNLDLALYRGMLDGVGHRFGASDRDVEYPLIGESSLGGDLRQEIPTAGHLRQVRREDDRADYWLWRGCGHYLT
jgi:hypothetical protein